MLWQPSTLQIHQLESRVAVLEPVTLSLSTLRVLNFNHIVTYYKLSCEHYPIVCIFINFLYFLNS
jgi:hypothetical protein